MFIQSNLRERKKALHFLFNLKYSPFAIKGLAETYVGLDANFVSAQNNIVPPEIKTPGYKTITLMAGTQIRVKNQHVSVNFQIQNLLNQKYFNHTSYYRIINIPESGRSFILTINIPFRLNNLSNLKKY